jgi:hypothetical protein
MSSTSPLWGLPPPVGPTEEEAVVMRTSAAIPDRVYGAKGLADGYEAALDAHFEDMVSNPAFPVPGVVVHLRRGADVYSKAFGYADVASGRPMETDAMIRMWSMTKVLTCFTALRLYEDGLFKLEDEVADYIPSFRREWRIVRPDGEGSESSSPLVAGWSSWKRAEGVERVDYFAFLKARVVLLMILHSDQAFCCLSTETCLSLSHSLTLFAVKGKEEMLAYRTEPAKKTMRIKHLMSETSGIEYDQFSEYDERSGGALGCGMAGAVASALRQKLNPDVFRSTNILGADLDLAGFVDTVAAAGVLVCEPGPSRAAAASRAPDFL